MNLKSDYDKLYQHWLKEFGQIDLTPLDQRTFNEYNKLVDSVGSVKEPIKDIIKNKVITAIQDNLKFLYKDILKLREIKIINAALNLKQIDLNKVMDSEKLFYQNLVGAIKGFKKIKALSIFEEEVDDYIKEIIKPNEIESSEPEQQGDITQEETELDVTLESPSENEHGSYRYLLVRFTKDAPSLVGIDLNEYGPFEKNDIVNLPYNNAKILIYEEFAEKIELE